MLKKYIIAAKKSKCDQGQVLGKSLGSRVNGSELDSLYSNVIGKDSWYSH